MNSMNNNIEVNENEVENLTQVGHYNVLTTKDVRKAAFRFIYASQLSWSYSKMMAPGFLYSVYPCLKKIYADNPEGLKESMDMHIEFFNTNPMTGNIIVGISLGMEEQGNTEMIPAVAGLKAGLMGPFAGVGDTIFGVVVTTIFGSIAAYMALEGSFVGLFIWSAVLIAIAIGRFKFTTIGYKGGVSLVTEFASKLQNFTNAAIVLGLVVVGGLIPTIVKANLNSSIVIRDVPVDLQAMSDMILPKLVPLLVVLFCFYMLDRKWVNSTRLIFIVMGLGILLSAVNILV